MPRLSAAQISMLMFETLHGHLEDPTTYYHTVAIELDAIDLNILQKALHSMIKRHQSLRSKLTTVGQEGKYEEKYEQHAHEVDLDTFEEKDIPFTSSWPLSFVDGRELKSVPAIADLAQTLKTLNRTDLIYRHFKLYEEPLWRAWIVQFTDKKYHLGFLFHHIIFDVASQNIFLKELTYFYNNQIKKLPYHLSAPLNLDEIKPINEKNEKTKRLAYWRKTLADLEAAELKPDFPTKDKKNFAGDRVPVVVPAEVVKRLSNQYKTNHKPVSLHSVFTSFLALLISRYTGERDIYLATASANRRNYIFPVDEVINCFVNTIPLRIPISGENTSLEFVHAIRQIAKEAFQHQIAIADICQEIVDQKGQHIKAPKGIFVFNQKKAGLKLLDNRGQLIKSTSPIELNLHRCKLDWGFELTECEDGSYQGFFDFDTDLFAPSTFVRVAQHFLQMCRTTSPHLKLHHIPMVTRDDVKVLTAANDTDRPLISQEFFHEYFMRVAKDVPDELCTVFYDGEKKCDTLTYKQFDALSSQQAAHLQKLGITPGTRVAVCISRSNNLFAGTMAAFKAGCVVVQLEAKESQAEKSARDFKVKDAQPTVILVDNATIGFFSDVKVKTVNVEDKFESVSAEQYRPPSIKPDAPMYITYTSGTTGQPKGAINTWGGNRNLIHAWLDSNLTRGNHTLVTALSTFDSWYVEWIMAIAAKGKAIFVYDQGRLSVDVLTELNKLYPLHVLVLLPKILEQLDPNVFSDVRDVTSMGESETNVRTWIKEGRVVRIEYGVSEASAKNTVHVISHDTPKNGIGLPIRNTKLFVLDVNGGRTECPPGVVGELYIAGIALAQGYLNQDELTRVKFVTRFYNPTTRVFHTPEEAPHHATPIRLYKTGDLAVYTEKGTLVHVGRADDQIKMHGQRIELSGIATLLKSMPESQIQEVLVIPDKEKKYLIVYLVLADKKSIITLESIQAHLRKSNIPAVALPRALHVLDSFPLNKNGKIDRKALPEPRLAYVEKVDMPTTDLQSKLRKEWASVFGRPEEQISVKKTFEELGGDSLRIVWLLNRMNNPARVPLPPWRHLPIQIFSPQMTIESLERDIQSYLHPAYGSLSPGNTKGHLTFQNLFENTPTPLNTGPIDDLVVGELQYQKNNNTTFDGIFS